MTTLDIKQKLISKINETHNNELLEEMYRLIENEDSDDNIYVFSEEQRNAVKESQEQYRNGQFLSGEQADNEIEELISK